MYEQKAGYLILSKYGGKESLEWLRQRITDLCTSNSTKDLYMTYSLLNSKFNGAEPIEFKDDVNENNLYFKTHNATLLDVSRIYLLSEVINADALFYTDKVANIIQVADTGELETFLKYLILLPNPEAYKQTAVEALRTNIETIFDAISMHNPYPAKFFNDQQWNQMYLKAAFMGRDLSYIEAVDERANSDLTRIISDYAHERWAASRKIDPMFWRPVTKFIEGELVNDMKRLLNSEDVLENRAGALCCFYANSNEAIALLDDHKDLKKTIEQKILTWNTLKN